MTSDHHQHPYHLPPSSSTSISSSLPLLPPLSLPLSLSSTSAAALTNALLAQHYARSRQQQDNMNNNNNNTTSSSNATNWRPQYMPFNPSLSSMMSNNKNTSHHHHHSVNNNATGGGSATTSTTSTAQNHTSDDFQETKSITLEWKLSNLKNIFSSSQGDQKSKCIKSPLFGDGKWEIYFYANSGSDYISLYLSAEPTNEERERGLKFAARSRFYNAALLASKSGNSNGNPASFAALAAAGKLPPHQHHLLHHGNGGAGGSHSFLHQHQLQQYQQMQQQQQQQQQQNQNQNQNAQSQSQSQAQPPAGAGQPPPAATAANTAANMAPWIREGSFRFAFEVRSTNKKETPIKMMEAADHVFSSEARNWGWQSFARRTEVYHNNMVVRHSDSFVIVCTITHTPAKPSTIPNHLTLQKRLMPLELVNAFAGMFDDPLYSDVKFVVRNRSSRTGKTKEKTLYAIRKILSSRAEYFETMFSSGFSEDKTTTTSDGPTISRRSSMRFQGTNQNNSTVDDGDSDMSSIDSDEMMGIYDSASEGGDEAFHDDEDSQDEDSVVEDDDDDNIQPGKDGDASMIDKRATRKIVGDDGIDETEDESDDDDDDEDDETENEDSHTAHTTINNDDGLVLGSSVGTEPLSPRLAVVTPSSNRNTVRDGGDDMKVDTSPTRSTGNASLIDRINVSSPTGKRYPTRHSLRGSVSGSLNDVASERAGTSTMRSISTSVHTSQAAGSQQMESPRARRASKRAEAKTVPTANNNIHNTNVHNTAAHSGRKEKKKTDTFNKECVTVVVKDANYSTYKALLYYLYTDTITFAPLSSIYAHAKDTAEAYDRPFPYKTRKQFFDAYTAAIYGPNSHYHTRPKNLICSSKAIYKLADKLNIPELKARAFEHIVQSLTIETIPYEVFSAFSDQFPEVRKVQIEMMLHYWNDVREGQAMKNVLRLIRLEPDRFPGYEDVWQHLLMNLEYRANTQASHNATSPLKESTM